MTLILDNIAIPDQGVLEVDLKFTIEIKVTAEQARQQVDHWLMDQVSSQMGAETPTLVAGEQIVWRVPAYISFPTTGRLNGIGTIDVDVLTGEMLNLAGKLEEINAYLEKEVRPKLPPYQPRRDMPTEFMPKTVALAEKASIGPDGYLKPTE